VRIDPTAVDSLRAELETGLAQYRSGGVRAQRDGCRTQMAALVKLAEYLLVVAGVSSGEQGEKFLPIRELHAAVTDLNRWVRPRLLQPMPMDNRPPINLPETMRRGDLAAAFELWRQAHRGSGKSKNVLAGEVAHKFDSTMQGKTILKYRQTAVSGADPGLAERYRDMLRLVETT
jgi:hypothetical protein